MREAKGSYSINYHEVDKRMAGERGAQRRAGIFYESSLTGLAIGVGIGGVLLSGCSAPAQPAAPEALTSPLETPTQTEGDSTLTPSPTAGRGRATRTPKPTTQKLTKGFSNNPAWCQDASGNNYASGEKSPNAWELIDCVKDIKTRTEDSLWRRIDDKTKKQIYAAVSWQGKKRTLGPVVIDPDDPYKITNISGTLKMKQDGIEIFCLKGQYCELENLNKPIPIIEPTSEPTSSPQPPPNSITSTEELTGSQGVTVPVRPELPDSGITDTHVLTDLTGVLGVHATEGTPTPYMIVPESPDYGSVAAGCLLVAGTLVAVGSLFGGVAWIRERKRTKNNPVFALPADPDASQNSNAQKKPSQPQVVNGEIVDRQSFEPVKPEPQTYSEALYPDTLRTIAGRKGDKSSHKS